MKQSRSKVVESGCCVCAGRCPVISSFRSVAGSALGCGCCSWLVRESVRSLSGWVLVAEFGSSAVAAAFARRWAGRLPVQCRGCVVRRSGAFWAVSVPVVR